MPPGSLCEQQVKPVGPNYGFTGFIFIYLERLSIEVLLQSVSETMDTLSLGVEL